MRALRLLLLHTRLALMNELAYRFDFVVQLLESGVNLGTSLVWIAVIFRHTEKLNGWDPTRLVALVGIFILLQGLRDVLIQPGLSRFMGEVRSGNLDFTLLKPEDAQVLISVRQVRVWKIADLLVGACTVGVAVSRMSVEIGWREVSAFGITLLSGAVITYSFMFILATLSFWLIRVDNILYVFQALFHAGRWPVGIYPRALRYALTCLVPVAFAVTVPARALTGKLDSWTLVASLALATASFVAARLFWRVGLRRYTGASA
jgi:ABC-2 type transport system permease protein